MKKRSREINPIDMLMVEIASANVQGCKEATFQEAEDAARRSLSSHAFRALRVRCDEQRHHFRYCPVSLSA